MLANNNSQPLISPPTSVAVLTVSWLHILVVRKKKVNEANSLWAAQRRQEDQNLIFVNWWCGYKVDAIDLLSNYTHNIFRSTTSWGGEGGDIVPQWEENPGQNLVVLPWTIWQRHAPHSLWADQQPVKPAITKNLVENHIFDK